MCRLVAVMKEVYGEEEYNKHKSVEWELKADACSYYNTPEQGDSECGFYALKFAATYDGNTLVEKIRHKDVSMNFFYFLSYYFLFDFF